jgi:signal transduction histidine kinase
VITPLKSKGGIQGVLAISTRELRQFLPQDLDTIQAIGNQIGLAIENARLYENLRFYLHEITRAQENERKRIARELHDETIQVLIALSRRLELLTTMSDQLPAPALQPLKSSQELIGNTLREMRRFIQDLRPPSLDHLGLVAALEGLVSDLDQNGIKAELAVIGLERRLVPEDTELMLFRIAQEALSNVRRHSGASKVNLQAEFSSDQLRMQITDNGCGFNAPERMSDLVSSGRLGLIGMHERARTLGGVLTIRSKPDHGTTVMVEVGLGERIHPF